jgi:hypothetical protein
LICVGDFHRAREVPAQHAPRALRQIVRPVTHRRNAGARLNPHTKKKFSERRYGALKKGAARFWKRAAPMKAIGGVTPVADFYQKSMVALFL